MKVYNLIVLSLLFHSAFSQSPSGREISLETSEKSFTLGEPFVLSVLVKNSARRPKVQFPELDGLEKRSASAVSTTGSVAGKPVVVQTISQNYYALKSGKLKVKPSLVIVDEAKIRVEALSLIIKEGKPAGLSTNDESKNSGTVVSDNELKTSDIFLSLHLSKPVVYAREGFAVRLALYVSQSAPIEMEFYQLDTQLKAILKKLRPATCWEENVGIEEIVQRSVSLGGRQYTEYQMYQAIFFPITLQAVSFPAVGLDMMMMMPEADGKKSKTVKTFYSDPARVLVKPLPPHPFRDQVAVGQYQLRESVMPRTLAPGESLRYLFTITGEGNLATLTAPTRPINSAFDFYPPELSQTIRRSYEKVSGEKTFDYYMVARQNGIFPLGRYFQWVYFDPVRARYDTLQSEVTVRVAGKSSPAQQLAGQGVDTLYDRIETLDSGETNVDYQQIVRTLTNIVLAFLLGLMIWILRQ